MYDDIPNPILDDLQSTQDAEFIAEQVERYRAASKKGKADILAFHMPMAGSNVSGVEQFRQRDLEGEDGTPTASEMERWWGNDE